MSDLYDLKNSLRYVFEVSKEAQPDCRVRVSKGKLKDDIKLGMYESTLIRFMSKREIILAIKHNLLTPHKIMPDGRTVKNVLLWNEYECKQATPIKNLIFKIREFFSDLKDTMFNLWS